MVLKKKVPGTVPSGNPPQKWAVPCCTMLWKSAIRTSSQHLNTQNIITAQIRTNKKGLCNVSILVAVCSRAAVLWHDVVQLIWATLVKSYFSALRYALLTFADNTCLLDVSLHRIIISIHFPLIYAIRWALLCNHDLVIRKMSITFCCQHGIKCHRQKKSYINIVILIFIRFVWIQLVYVNIQPTTQ